MGGVFISYRRADSQTSTGRLSDRLQQVLGPQVPLFVDIDSIRPGEDFRAVISETLRHCDVTLVMIGPQWASISAEDGSRRLDDPADLVRLEVESALAAESTTIPVLVEGATMPAPEELPESLRPLTSLHAAEVSTRRFAADSQYLSDLIRGHLTMPPTRSEWARGASIGLLLVVGAAILALGGVAEAGFDDPTGPGNATVVASSIDDATPDDPVEVDLDNDIEVSLDGIDQAAQAQLRFELASLSLGGTDWTDVVDGTATLDPGVARWTAAGAVVAELRVRDGGGEVIATRSFPAEVKGGWYLTVTGAVMIVALLAGFAYVESGLRVLRRGRRRIGAFASTAFGGALLALSFILATVVFRTNFIASGLAFAALVLAAAGSLALGYTLFQTALRRRPA